MKRLSTGILLVLALLLNVVTTEEASAKIKRSHPKLETPIVANTEYLPETSPVNVYLNDLTKRGGSSTHNVASNKSTSQTSNWNPSASEHALVREASKYLGASARDLGLPSYLWCADFMNKLVGGTNRQAISYASRGSAASHGCIGCIVVTPRKKGHHVGVVFAYDKNGNPVTISGNHTGRRVGIGTYNRHLVIAYRFV